MEKETSCINSRAILDYLKGHNVDCSSLFGDLDPEIDGLEDPEKFLRDPNNWISCSVISKLYKRAKLILHDEKAAYKMGRYAAENISMGYAQRIVLKAFWSVRKGLRHAQKVNDQWNRSKKVELIELKQNKAIVRLYWNSEMEVTKDICLYNQGAYTSLPLVWGGSPVILKEKCCYFNGAPYCEYHLKWPFKNKFYEIYSRFFTSKSVLIDTIKEMEKDKKIIEGKTEKLKNEVEERKQMEEALRESEERFRDLTEKLPEVVFETNRNLELTYANRRAFELFGYSAEDLKRGLNGLELITPADRDRAKANIAMRLKGEDPGTVEYQALRKDGSSFPVLFHASSIIKEGELFGLRGIIVDITDRKQAEEKIKASLKEKEILLQEIHHRVKNNMQVISSLLRLQASGVGDERVTDALMECQGRVQTMAFLHETLYGSDTLTVIDFKTYISKLASKMIQSYVTNKGRVKVKVNTEDIKLSIEQATSLGLIVNELVSNSLKHAFPQDRTRQTKLWEPPGSAKRLPMIISIDLRSINENEFELKVSDNGIGIPEGLDWRNTDSLGLQLVILLAENQLDGTVSLDRENGTHFTVRFRHEDNQ